MFLSVSCPFVGDYVHLRQNALWKKICMETNDQYVVFADIINKISRTNGRVSVLTGHIFIKLLIIRWTQTTETVKSSFWSQTDICVSYFLFSFVELFVIIYQFLFILDFKHSTGSFHCFITAFGS